jgi:DNA-binding CsgD family transcriptional regulator
MAPTPEEIAERLARLAGGGSADQWCPQVEALLHRAVPFDAAGWQPIDPVSLLMTGHWSRQLPDPDPARFAGIAHNEYALADVNRFADLAAAGRPVATLAEATSGRPDRSPRYRDVLRPFGFGPELRAALTDRGSCWGSLILVRQHTRADFTAAEVDFVTRLVPALALLMRRDWLAAAATGPEPGAPGVVLVDADGTPRSRTATAARWLSLLTGEPPPVLTALAAAARTHGSASVTIRAGDGVWLTLDAAVLDADPDHRLSVIVGPAAPAALSARLVAAFDLSPRERDVVRLVLAGRSTTEIGRALFITPYTVKDHLKAVFDKTGVRSRRELPGRLFPYQQSDPPH